MFILPKTLSESIESCLKADQTLKYHTVGWNHFGQNCTTVKSKPWRVTVFYLALCVLAHTVHYLFKLSVWTPYKAANTLMLLEQCSRGSMKKKRRIHFSVGKSRVHKPKYPIFTALTLWNLFYFKTQIIPKPGTAGVSTNVPFKESSVQGSYF